MYAGTRGCVPKAFWPSLLSVQVMKRWPPRNRFFPPRTPCLGPSRTPREMCKHQ